MVVEVNVAVKLPGTVEDGAGVRDVVTVAVRGNPMVRVALEVGVRGGISVLVVDLLGVPVRASEREKLQETFTLWVDEKLIEEL